MILVNFKDFPKNGKLLGIDWGSRRIGLAVSSAEQSMVFPRPAIKTINSEPVRIITDLIRDENITGIVIGLPIRVDGTDSDTTTLIRLWSAELSEYTNLPIIFIEENLTSMAAEEYTTDKNKIDSVAAAIILENAISMIKRTDNQKYD